MTTSLQEPGLPAVKFNVTIQNLIWPFNNTQTHILLSAFIVHFMWSFKALLSSFKEQLGENTSNNLQRPLHDQLLILNLEQTAVMRLDKCGRTNVFFQCQKNDKKYFTQTFGSENDHIYILATTIPPMV